MCFSTLSYFYDLFLASSPLHLLHSFSLFLFKRFHFAYLTARPIDKLPQPLSSASFPQPTRQALLHLSIVAPCNDAPEVMHATQLSMLFALFCLTNLTTVPSHTRAPGEQIPRFTAAKRIAARTESLNASTAGRARFWGLAVCVCLIQFTPNNSCASHGLTMQ